jgi:hypothetical protein
MNMKTLSRNLSVLSSVLILGISPARGSVLVIDSFTLAEISLVPEPSPFLLTLASGCALACRRRRPAVLN